MFKFKSYLPSKNLSGVVKRYFVVQAHLCQPFHNVVLPSVMQSIVLNISGGKARVKLRGRTEIESNANLIAGQYTKSLVCTLQGDIDFVGIHFQPTGLFRLLNQPMSKFSDAVNNLDRYGGSWAAAMFADILRDTSSEARISTIESHLSRQVFQAGYTIDLTQKIADLIHLSPGDTLLADIGSRYGLSERTMQRYFLKYVGVTPKKFASIARFNAVTKMIEMKKSLQWHGIFEEVGYVDHAHFARDFKKISGKTPTEYYQNKTEYEKFFYGA